LQSSIGTDVNVRHSTPPDQGLGAVTIPEEELGLKNRVQPGLSR
jgi:hypothetical protein